MASSLSQLSNDLSYVVEGTPLSPSVNYLFLGNPGTGKSTLINCLAGTPVFDSGLSYGGGLTKEFQKRIHDNVQYMDTPGLADRNIQEKAAAAITEALQQSGVYKLFFMVRLENGRVVSDDLATIEIVLNSIEMNDIPFAVLVNNVKKRQYAELAKKGADYLKIVTVINSINHTTPHIAFIPVIDDLDEEDNAVAELPGDVESFIRFEAPTVPIVPQSVKSIEIQDFKEMSERLREAQNELLNDNAMLERRVAELMGKSNSLWDLLGKLWEILVSAVDYMTPSTHDKRGNINIGMNTQANNQPMDEDWVFTHLDPSVVNTAALQTKTDVRATSQQSNVAALRIACQTACKSATGEADYASTGTGTQRHNERQLIDSVPIFQAVSARENGPPRAASMSPSNQPTEDLQHFQSLQLSSASKASGDEEMPLAPGNDEPNPEVLD